MVKTLIWRSFSFLTGLLPSLPVKSHLCDFRPAQSMDVEPHLLIRGAHFDPLWKLCPIMSDRLENCIEIVSQELYPEQLCYLRRSTLQESWGFACQALSSFPHEWKTLEVIGKSLEFDLCSSWFMFWVHPLLSKHSFFIQFFAASHHLLTLIHRHWNHDNDNFFTIGKSECSQSSDPQDQTPDVFLASTTWRTGLKNFFFPVLILSISFDSCPWIVETAVWQRISWFCRHNSCPNATHAFR